MREQPIDTTPDLIVWVAAFIAAIAFTALVIGAAVLVSRARAKFAGLDEPPRTSAVTWIALVGIMAFLVVDLAAVLFPAIHAATQRARNSDHAPR